ncbi:heme o synthase [Acidiferrobacter sp.]|uniref:heme o synthase n=1 Tax=Acidiferrobacter sp. TaxID=1872107 RepID=UPI00262A3F2D|nr:heme o synthase [Acidiferrobacter sp.]
MSDERVLAGSWRSRVMVQSRSLGVDLAVVQSYCELTKPRVVSLLIFTAMVGMMLASPAHMAAVHWSVILWANIGIALASGAAAAINHVVDRQIDGQMRRTHMRPLPNDAISVTGALIFATILMAVSGIVLTVFVNKLTAILTMAGLVGYAGIYTGFLKRRTPQNIVLGGAAGAIPPVLGWASVTGHAPLASWVLFLIIFLWTPAHFWPLAIYRRDDYARVGIPMMPVSRGVRHTSWLILAYTVGTVLATQLPYLVGMAGTPYLIGANILGAGFLYHALRLIYAPDRHNPMRMFGYSIVYLAALFAMLLADHYMVGL